MAAFGHFLTDSRCVVAGSRWFTYGVMCTITSILCSLATVWLGLYGNANAFAIFLILWSFGLRCTRLFAL